ILFKVFFVYRFKIVATMAYVVMGWIGVFAAKPMLAKLADGGIALLVAGGAAYTLGVIFYLWKRLPYSHAIWHIFVLVGSVCHFFAVIFYVLPIHL
ncbi:MAG: hemolysin III family protein, partial [Smithellaceae bacterium]|nr:hemolysin III family protein [Smithellaceae bacterium]